MRIRSHLIGTAAVIGCLGSATAAQDLSYNLYGTPGLLELPTARSAADAEVGATISAFAFQQRGNFTFQLTPRLSGTFRYAGIQERGEVLVDTLDRSFDLRYRILDEGDYLPAVAIGLRDFLGTGLYSSEYIVASKAFGDRIDVTAGLGWGRLGTRDGITNPLGAIDDRFETRPALDFRLGGEISANQFFRGDMGVFGGIAYHYNDKLTFKAEYSSDDYAFEQSTGALTDPSPINVGLNYTYRPGLELQLAYLYGQEIAAGATFTLNPRTRLAPSGRETAPLPVAVRPTDARAAASWGTDEETLTRTFADAGLTLNSYDATADTVVRVRYTNNTYRSEAQAMGRAARILANLMPAAVNSFVLEPMQRGIPLTATTLNRADLERLENRATGAYDLRDRATFADAGAAVGYTNVDPIDPAFTWGIGPYANLVVFNINDPLRVDVGLDLKARYTISPNLVLSGTVRQSALGAREPSDEFQNDDDVPNVRTDARLYGVDGFPVIQSLTLAHYARPGADLYSRVSAGYLEKMHGGVSAELLWKPVDSRLALGAEVNYTVQRDFDQLFGFQDYDVVTGHVSGYYSFDNGFHAQLDVGRYLAGDWGATFGLDREFDNGWKVGAYFSVTDMPFEDFGEGSFDKGIRITVPNDFFLGTATQDKVQSNLASLSRDGGARLNVDGRLYEVVRPGHEAGLLGDTWGRFWR